MTIQNLSSVDLLVSEILIFKLTLIYKFLNVPRVLGFDGKHSKIFCRSFMICIIILSMGGSPDDISEVLVT